MHPATEALLRWWDENAREMPWRGIRNPYGTWVSEIMLQQTRVDTVRDYYTRFMARFPTVRALAEAREEDVLKIWEGLGYYSRARNLHRGAQQVCEEFGGEIPRDPETLRRIRGIGPYTSCSIASIAYDVPVAAVDGNVIRVLCRLYGLGDDPTETKARARIGELAEELVPEKRAGDHNQAMMDLGATVCVPGTPDCERCPLSKLCRARAEGTAEELPRLPKARPPREKEWDVLLIFSGERVLMYRREEKLLQGLWCFPMTEGHRTPEELRDAVRRKYGLETEKPEPAGEARHVFTHQVWRMKLYLLRVNGDAPEPAGMRWIPRGEIRALPMPTAVQAARRIAETQGERD